MYVSRAWNRCRDVFSFLSRNAIASTVVGGILLVVILGCVALAYSAVSALSSTQPQHTSRTVYNGQDLDVAGLPTLTGDCWGEAISSNRAWRCMTDSAEVFDPCFDVKLLDLDHRLVSCPFDPRWRSGTVLISSPVSPPNNANSPRVTMPVPSAWFFTVSDLNCRRSSDMVVPPLYSETPFYCSGYPPGYAPVSLGSAPLTLGGSSSLSDVNWALCSDPTQEQDNWYVDCWSGGVAFTATHQLVLDMWY